MHPNPLAFICLLPLLTRGYNLQHPKGKSSIYYDEDPDRHRGSGRTEYVTRQAQHEVVPGFKRKVYVELPEKYEKAYRPGRAEREPDDDGEVITRFAKQAPKVVTIEDGGRQFYDTEEEAAARGRSHGQPLKAITQTYDLKDMAKLSRPLKDYLSSLYETTKSEEETTSARDGGRRRSSNYLSSLDPIPTASYYPSSSGKRHDDGSEEIVYGTRPSYENNQRYATNFGDSASYASARDAERPTYHDAQGLGDATDDAEDSSDTYSGREMPAKKRFASFPRDNSMTLSYEPDVKKKYHTTTTLGDEDEESAPPRSTRGGNRKQRPSHAMLADEGEEEEEESEPSLEQPPPDEYGGRPGRARQGRSKPVVLNNEDEDGETVSMAEPGAIEKPVLNYYEPGEQSSLMGDPRVPRYPSLELGPQNDQPEGVKDWGANLENYAREFGFEMPEQHRTRTYRPLVGQSYPLPLPWAASQRKPTFKSAVGAQASEIKPNHLSPPPANTTAHVNRTISSS